MNMLLMGTRIYRIFLLSWVLGVLWAKGYLWWVFGIALLLYVWDAILFPFIVQGGVSLPESSEPESTDSAAAETSSRTSRRWAAADEEKPAEREDDFREPRPGRSSPRRKGS
jgi:hypothetical protein